MSFLLLPGGPFTTFIFRLTALPEDLCSDGDDVSDDDSNIVTIVSLALSL